MAWFESGRPGETALDASPGAPYELLDDGYPPEPCDVLVVGCGNILRGDDAVGPTLIRHLFTRGVPAGVRLVDGGTAGMDVAFGMRGASRVVVVDASRTGADPGTIHRVPAAELAELPPLEGLHSHNFRWDHALSLARWLLGPQCPTDVVVYLVEGADFAPGAPLSPPVEAAMQRVAEMLERELFPAAETAYVEITGDGYVHLPAALAARHIPGGAVAARVQDDGRTLLLVPLASSAHGGLVLKQRNAAGDRSIMVADLVGLDHLDDRAPARLDVRAGSGPIRCPVRWDEAGGVLLVDLAADQGLQA